MKGLGLLAMLFFVGRAAGPPAVPIGFDDQTLMKHRLRGESTLPAPAGGRSTWDGIPIIVTISPQGLVTAARVDREENDERASPAAALAEARRWKFRPFRYRGSAVWARGTITISYRSAERWRDPAARLPRIDYSSLKISLARSNCFGSCPDYDVTIDGNGTVEFNNRPFPGRRARPVASSTPREACCFPAGTSGALSAPRSMR